MLSVDLSHPALPLPRLAPSHDDPAVIRVPAYTDLKLHDVGNPGDALAREPLDMNQTVWSPKFKAGNQRFLTKRLWGAANEPPYFHHGLFTTMRQAVLAHSGEALESRRAFQRRTKYRAGLPDRVPQDAAGAPAGNEGSDRRRALSAQDVAAVAEDDDVDVAEVAFRTGAVRLTRSGWRPASRWRAAESSRSNHQQLLDRDCMRP